MHSTLEIHQILKYYFDFIEDPCNPNPCQNGAQCMVQAASNGYGGSSSSYVCQCPAGYTGQNCETCDPCTPNPCNNGGQCTAYGNSYQCSCVAPYTGQNCEQQDSCSSNP